MTIESAQFLLGSGAGSTGEAEAGSGAARSGSFDLRIDTTQANDLVFTNGRLEVVRGPEARAQRIGVALRHVRGEWFLDQNAGTDYFGKVLGKSSDLSRRAEFRRRVLSVPGVREIQAMTLRIDPKTRALSGQIDVLDGTGVTLSLPIEGV